MTATLDDLRKLPQASDPRFAPFDDLNEAAAIGSLLCAPWHIRESMRVVDADDFHIVRYRVAWRVMSEMVARGEKVDNITLGHRLKELPEFAGLNMNGWMIQTINSASWSFHAVTYARLVHEDAIRRRSIAAADTLRGRLASGDSVDAALMDHTSIVGKLENELKADDIPTADAFIEHFHDLDIRAERGDTLAGLSTGYPALDAMTGGLQVGYHLIGARPGVGKTALMCNMALHMLEAGKRVLFVSLEMTREQLFDRFHAASAGVNIGSIVAPGRLAGDEYRRLLEAHGTLYALIEDKLEIVTPQRGRMTPTMLAGIVAKHKRDGLDVVFVDYLGLMTASERYKNRNEEVASISAGLLSLAMDSRLPVVAASQLNRRSTERADRKPDLSDLRDSGALEQDAHTVMMLWRPDEDAEGYDPHIAELALVKNRFGPTGTVPMYWDGPTTRFMSARTQSIDLKTLRGAKV